MSPGAAPGATAHQSSDTCAAHVLCTMMRIWWACAVGNCTKTARARSSRPPGSAAQAQLMNQLSRSSRQALLLTRDRRAIFSLFGARNPSSRADQSRESASRESAAQLSTSGQCRIDFLFTLWPLFSEHIQVREVSAILCTEPTHGQKCCLLLVIMLKGPYRMYMFP